MTKKTTAFDSTNQAREQATVSGTSKETAKKKITLSITQEDSDAVKMYALKNHTTVSDLLHEWIQEYCQD